MTVNDNAAHRGDAKRGQAQRGHDRCRSGADDDRLRVKQLRYGVTYTDAITPREHFDAMLFVAETTAAALPHASWQLVGSRDEDAAGQLAQIRTEITGFLGRAVVPR